MGFFRKRRDTPASLAVSEVPDEAASAAELRARTPEEEGFAAAIAHGDMQAASHLLDQHIAATVPADLPGDSLLERAAFVRRALLDGRLDAAADRLTTWEITYAAFGRFLDPEQTATLNTLGLLLLDYFGHPLAAGHDAYDELMDERLAGVAKATRIGSPTRQTPWDPVYARIKSDREMSRAR
jgi:hypothetical protein